MISAANQIALQARGVVLHPGRENSVSARRGPENGARSTPRKRWPDQLVLTQPWASQQQ